MNVRGRIDAVKGVDDTTLTAWLTAVGTNLVLVHHILPQMSDIKWETQEPRQDTTNPHYHFYLETTYKSVQSMAYQMKKTFVNLAKSDWSIKPCDPARRDEYFQYLFNTKHGNQWKLVQSFTQMESYILEATNVSKDFEKRRQEKQKQKSGHDISMELAHWMKVNNYQDTTDYKLVTTHAIELHRLYKKSFCLFSLERVIITALGEVKPERLAEAIHVKLTTKLNQVFF